MKKEGEWIRTDPSGVCGAVEAGVAGWETDISDPAAEVAREEAECWRS
jgi:hypothetical protein